MGFPLAPVPAVPGWSLQGRTSPATVAQRPGEVFRPAPEVISSEGRLTTVAPPLALTVEVTTGTAATTVGSGLSAPYGRLETVTPVSLAGATIPRGRMYAELWVVDSGGEPRQCLWRGYPVTSGAKIAGPSSTPGVVLYPSWQLKAVVTQTDQGASTRVGFICHVQPDLSAPSPSGSIHAEEAGSGEGETVRIPLAAPAAGADYADATVPAASRWRVDGVMGTLTSSAAVANRIPRVLYRTGGVTVGTHGAPVPQTASIVWTWMFGRGLGLTTAAPPSNSTIEVPTQPRQLQTGDVVRVSTNNIDVADQWAAGSIIAVVWAVPA